MGCAGADIVLTAPEVRLPLLFLEADNCTEAAKTAAKFDKYMRHSHRKAKDTDGQDKPMWRTRSSTHDPRWGDASHPPVLLVFNPIGKRSALKQMEKVVDLTPSTGHGDWNGLVTRPKDAPVVQPTCDVTERPPAQAC
ncbi:hypothetical protein [Streptomyces sp. DG1A-41]|uniref:hypothetical protein n=1 Tax=Streptomyces sp. DG1A-41 TaxID=3125779 RepID=UPI0030D56BBF